jgi:hypothetical protein
MGSPVSSWFPVIEVFALTDAFKVVVGFAGVALPSEKPTSVLAESSMSLAFPQIHTPQLS